MLENATEAESDEDEDDVHINFLDETLDEAAAESTKRQKNRVLTDPWIMFPQHVFSRCGIILRPLRRLMDPSTLEMLIMLRFNKDLWDAREVDEAIKCTTHTEIISASSTPVPRSSLADEMILGASSSSS